MRQNLWLIGDLLTTFTVAALTVAAGHLVPFPVILAGAAVVGVVGCFMSTLPRVEYLVVVVTAVAFAGVFHQIFPQLDPWILAMPGLAAGYMWGSVVADRLDKPNVARMQAEARESENTGD